MTWIGTILRTIFILCDMYVFYLVRYVYQLLFTIATFDFLDRQMIFHMFSRVQLILGVFMVFQLTMTIIKGIVNPDSFTDSKTGAGNIIMRIIVSLALLGLIVPLNIPSPKNDYEKQINNNGILFGTLYSLQNRILINNTLGKLILGDDTTNYEDSYGENESIMKIGDTFLSVVVKTFYQLNVDEDGNYVCDDGWDDTYNDENTTPIEIIANGWVPCGGAEGAFGDLAGNMRISYTYFLTTLVGIVLAVLLFMMTFNVAKRVFQLAALQLMAPIPIISYMDPKGSKDGAFNSWLKLLGKTYLELFIQLAVIYFAIGMINSFILRFPDLLLQSGENAFSDPFSGTIEVLSLTTSVASPLGPGLIKWTFIIVVISLFVFAKDAPKFFKQMLGIKDDGAGFFSAFGTAMGFGIAAAGAIGSFNSSRQASRDADTARAKDYASRQTGWTDAQKEAYVRNYTNSAGNRAKHALAGLFGAGAGIATGSAAASESKGNAMAKTMAAINAQNKRNQNVRARGRDGGTFFGGIGSLGQEVLMGQNEYDALEADWKAREQKIKDRELINKRDSDINSYRKAIMDRVNSKAVDNDKVIAKYTTTKYGEIKGNYRNWHSVSQAALTNGVGVYQIDIGGKQVDVFDYDGKQIHVADIGDLDYGMLDGAKEAYYKKAITDSTFDSEVWENKEAYEKAATDVKGSSVTIEDEWGHEDGIKSKFGAENRRIAKENGELSRQREQINTEKQGYQGQMAAANTKTFRDGK